MNRDEIIRMAREVSIDAVQSWKHAETPAVVLLERFAALVAAAEREKVRSSMKRAFRRMAGLIRADEREACAKVVENLPPVGPMRQLERATLKDAAVAIRARGQ